MIFDGWIVASWILGVALGAVGALFIGHRKSYLVGRARGLSEGRRAGFLEGEAAALFKARQHAAPAKFDPCKTQTTVMRAAYRAEFLAPEEPTAVGMAEKTARELSKQCQRGGHD